MDSVLSQQKQISGFGFFVDAFTQSEDVDA
jgi:hypothetical protein